MKAFLSHSSKDKLFVSQVAKALGSTQVEYDEATFEYAFNVEAIHRALNRSDLFVAFLSSNSINSTFVSEEQKAALEARGRGLIKRVLIFAIDGTSYKALPDWMRQLNIVRQVSSAKACAHKIQAALIELEAQVVQGGELFIGREEEEKVLRRALSAPPASTPIALHAVGHLGIGRRTFLRNSVSKVYPRLVEVYLEITLGQYQGIEELFRSIYDLHVVSSLEKTIADFDDFAALERSRKVSRITDLITEMADLGEFILIVDEGGVYDELGDYQSFIKDVISELAPRTDRPVLGFIQTRMMPLWRRQGYNRSYHVHLRPLSDETVKELLSFHLKEKSIGFSAEQLDAIAEHLDGHPFNVRFAVRFIAEYGIDSLLDDPSDLLEWKRRRAEDFLSRLEFLPIQVDIIAILAEYRYVASEMLLSLLKNDPADIASNLRSLEEFCCIERREGYFHISPPLRDAVRRDKRFDRSDDWKRSIGDTICDTIKDYKNDDFVSVPILETALMAAARTELAPAFLSTLILPSHLLRIARDVYDQGKRRLCIEFCKRAYSMKDRLPSDGVVEVLRLWGLSAIRLNDASTYSDVLDKLSRFTSQVAKRIRLFLQGFYHRTRGDLDKAEEFFLEAWRLSNDNQSINRELASLYCKQRRYNDAEAHARAAYQIAPTNPFIIDILAETLLGKVQMGLNVDRAEINQIMSELRTYGDAPGSSFYLIRDAQQKIRAQDSAAALVALNRAVERTPGLLTPYFLRAELLLQGGNVPGAERDLSEINRLLEAAGGLSEGDEAQAHELEVRILTEKRQFRVAKERIQKSAFLPQRVERRLLEQLARAIGFEPGSADAEMQQWAKTFSVNPRQDGSSKRR